jgi:putative ABC transport system permease protein
MIKLAAASALQLLTRSSVQFYRRHPAQLVLSVLGIILGVGIVTAVLITNSSASAAFSLSTEALYGRSSHHLVAADGIDDKRYAELRIAWPDVPMAPIIEGYVAQGDSILTLLGVDPFAEAVFARFGNAGADNAGIDTEALESTSQLLSNPRGVLVAETVADRQQLKIGDSLRIQTPTGEIEVLHAGRLSASNPSAADGVLLTDISRAQTWLERDGRLDRIELVLDENNIDAFTASLPPTLKLEPAATRRVTMQAMTRGFQINLTAMSLLALVVGGFLIHNTMSFAVLQRRELFASLRISGVTARQVMYTVLAEAAMISLAAAAIGVLLGRIIAEGLISLTTRTINDLYFVLHVQEVEMSPGLALLGVTLGVSTSVIAAFASALDAAATSPLAARQRSSTEERTRNLIGPLAAAGIGLICVGAALAVLPTLSLLVGFAALMLLILGYGLILPWLIHRLARVAVSLWGRAGVLASLALGGIERDISRTGIAIAALTVAVSATLGVDVMTGSFRSSVDDWLGTTLASDVYVSAPSIRSGEGALLEPSLAAVAATTPGIRAVSSGRALDVSTSVGRMETLVLEPHANSADSFEFVSGDPDSAWRQWHEEGAVLISEPLATKHSLTAGSTISLFTAAIGDRKFTVAGVFRDYASSHGKLMLSRAAFEKYWDDERISTLGILLEDTSGQQQAVVVEALRQRLHDAAGRALEIRSGRSIHEQSLAIFDRTFEVTGVLRWLTVGVAFIGIFSALLALHLERAKEFAVLRASGATRAQVGTLVVLQSGFMGLLAGFLAVPLGYIMSVLLIHVINVRSFGWHMQASIAPQALAGAIGLALMAALLAGLWPALRLTRGGIAQQLRDD